MARGALAGAGDAQRQRRRPDGETPGDRTRPAHSPSHGEPPGSQLDAAVLEATEGRPDDRDLPLDGHLHTVLSPDADVAIDTYAAAALARGIREIAITDHVDFEPTAPAFAFADLPTRERYVRDAAERWADRGLTICFGIEVTYQSRYDAEIREHLARAPYDHAIGSVHVMRGDPYTKDRVAAWVAGRPFAEIVAPYFAEVLAAARSGLFDVVGHLDFVKRYLTPHVAPAAFAAAPEVYEPILRALIESGTGLEVNTSGLRQAAEETYPAPWVVARFRELGGARVSIGSDAHVARSFAFGLGRGYDVAARAGFTDVALGGGGGSGAAGAPAPGEPPAAGGPPAPGESPGPGESPARERPAVVRAIPLAGTGVAG